MRHAARHEVVADSPVELRGFETLVPPRKGMVCFDHSDRDLKALLLRENQATFSLEGPTVRISFPPAASLVRTRVGRRATAGSPCSTSAIRPGQSRSLTRGHGFASAARSLNEVVRLSVYLPRNARALMRARQPGGEIYRKARSRPATTIIATKGHDLRTVPWRFFPQHLV